MQIKKPRVLVLGSTGLIGKAIAANLDDASDRVDLVRASRAPEGAGSQPPEGWTGPAT